MLLMKSRVQDLVAVDLLLPLLRAGIILELVVAGEERRRLNDYVENSKGRRFR